MHLIPHMAQLSFSTPRLPDQAVEQRCSRYVDLGYCMPLQSGTVRSQLKPAGGKPIHQSTNFVALETTRIPRTCEHDLTYSYTCHRSLLALVTLTQDHDFAAGRFAAVSDLSAPSSALFLHSLPHL